MLCTKRNDSTILYLFLPNDFISSRTIFFTAFCQFIDRCMRICQIFEIDFPENKIFYRKKLFCVSYLFFPVESLSFCLYYLLWIFGLDIKDCICRSQIISASYYVLIHKCVIYVFAIAHTEPREKVIDYFAQRILYKTDENFYFLNTPWKQENDISFENLFFYHITIKGHLLEK